MIKGQKGKRRMKKIKIKPAGEKKVKSLLKFPPFKCHESQVDCTDSRPADCRGVICVGQVGSRWAGG